MPLPLPLLFCLSFRAQRGTCFSLAKASARSSSHNPHRRPPLHLPAKLVPAALLLTALAAFPQSTPPQTPQPPAKPGPQQPAPPPHGQVLFQSHGAPPATPGEPPPDAAATPPQTPATTTGPTLTDTQRAAILFTAYDLDARLTPATSRLNMRALLTLRNAGVDPLSRIALQISSSLHWESVSLLAPTSAAPTKLPLAQHLIDTDADHTGQANEAVLTLPQPLAPGASLRLDSFYDGPIVPSAARLARLGASPAQARAADWDAIGPAPASSSSSAPSSSGSAQPPTLLAALRGFGDVLWYPVAQPQLFLGDGAELFHAIDRTRLAEQHATIRLRLAVEYTGEPPTAAYFCGRRQPLVALPDDPDAPVVSGHGIARAQFSAEPIGFRLPSLFVLDQPETLLASLPGAPAQSSSPAASNPPNPGASRPPTPSASSSSLSTDPAPAAAAASSVTAPMLAVETSDDGALPRLADSAETVAPLLQQWFGARPLTALTLLDHPGQPFEDGPLLVAPIASLAGSGDTGALAHSLTHAWVQTGQPWMDEGLAEFVSLLWIEQQKGREAAIAQLDSLVQPLALAEPDFTTPNAASPAPEAPAAPAPETSSSSSASAAANPAASTPQGAPLISASTAFYYRIKAAAVWWMLRDIAGDDPLRQALSAWRTQPVSHASAQAQAEAFERLLEKTSGKDLTWFFDDWVLHDRGLPDLDIVDVAPRELPAGLGHDTGWLVAITIRNRGAAAAEVPVIVRSGDLSLTKRLLIPGLREATERVVIESAPTEVIVNDGSVPEVRSSSHRLAVIPKPAP